MWMDFGISGSVPTGRTEKQVKTNEMAARLAGDECGVQMGSYPVPDKPRQTVKGSGGPRQAELGFAKADGRRTEVFKATLTRVRAFFRVPFSSKSRSSRRLTFGREDSRKPSRNPSNAPSPNHCPSRPDGLDSTSSLDLTVWAK